MKAGLRLIIVFGLLMAIFAPSIIGEAALVSYSSGISVQNLEATTATVTLNFYNPNGSLVPNSPQITLLAYESKTIFPLTQAPSGFNGSMVISSDKQINAGSRITGSDGVNPLAFGAAYTGFSSGSYSIGLPLLFKNWYSYDTWFSVQNVGGIATIVTVSYDDGVTAGPVTIQPGAAYKFDQKIEAHNAAGWVGSGTVTSTVAPIAAVAIEVSESSYKTLFAYSGVPSGSVNPVFPIAYANNYSFWLSIGIQNTGSTTTRVRVDYTHSPGYPGTDCYETRDIPAHTQINFMQFVFWPNPSADPDPGSLVITTCVRNQYFVGSARVTSNSPSQLLVGNINQLRYSTPYKGSASGAFSPSAGTTTVAFTDIMDRNFGYFSAWYLVNVGASQILSNQLVCTVRGIDGSNNPVTMTFSPPANIAAGGVWTEVQLNKIANGFLGSAICVGPVGSKLVGSAQYLDVNAAGDTLYSFEGVNK